MKKRSLSPLLLLTCLFAACSEKLPENYEPTPPSEKKKLAKKTIEPIKALTMIPQADISTFAQLDGTVTSGILFNRQGNMLIAKNDEIVTITPQGNINTFISLKEIKPIKNYYFSSPLVWDMVMDKSGNIIAAAQDRILIITEDGRIETLIEDSFNGFLGCSGIEIDADENIYFTNGNKIIRIAPGGKQSTWFDGSSHEYNSFFSLKFDPDYQKLYVTDFYTSSMIVIRRKADGSSSDPELIIQEPIKNAYPYGAPLNMVFDEDGLLYSSIDGMSEILKVSKEGKTRLIYIPGMEGNHYITFGTGDYGEDNVYVTTFNGRIIYQFPKSLLMVVH